MANTIAKRNNVNGYNGSGDVVDIFHDSFRRFFDGNFWDIHNNLTAGSVPVNIRENNRQYELDVVAPGCVKENFSIRVENKVLTISLSKPGNSQPQKEGWVRNEFVQRQFRRSFTLDDSINTGNITATYTDGILRIILVKNEQANIASRQIGIK